MVSDIVKTANGSIDTFRITTHKTIQYHLQLEPALNQLGLGSPKGGLVFTTVHCL